MARMTLELSASSKWWTHSVLWVTLVYLVLVRVFVSENCVESIIDKVSKFIGRHGFRYSVK